jgi:hypothetical protein
MRPEDYATLSLVLQVAQISVTVWIAAMLGQRR